MHRDMAHEMASFSRRAEPGSAGRSADPGSGDPARQWNQFRSAGDGRIQIVAIASGDFELTVEELRAVSRFVVVSAQEVLPVFEGAAPGDGRPRAAIDAAWAFVNGARRTKLQRVTALDAHRAAKAVGTEVARLAARSAGDAASAAYLHPIAQADQVGHILRAAASAARIAELRAGDDHAVGETKIEQARQRATPVLIDVLSRYPEARAANNRVAQLMITLDTALRAPR